MHLPGDNGLTTLVCMEEYSKQTGSILCLLIPWLLASPGNQQTWHWLSGIKQSIPEKPCPAVRNTPTFECLWQDKILGLGCLWWQGDDTSRSGWHTNSLSFLCVSPLNVTGFPGNTIRITNWHKKFKSIQVHSTPINSSSKHGNNVSANQACFTTLG